MYSELETTQDANKSLQDETQTAREKAIRLGQELASAQAEVKNLKETNETLTKKAEKYDAEVERYKKTIADLQERTGILTKENETLGKLSQVLRSYCGSSCLHSISSAGRAMDHIKALRHTADAETQAQTFYEMCLVLIQKVEAYKSNLHEVPSC